MFHFSYSPWVIFDAGYHRFEIVTAHEKESCRRIRANPAAFGERRRGEIGRLHCRRPKKGWVDRSAGSGKAGWLCRLREEMVGLELSRERAQLHCTGVLSQKGRIVRTAHAKNPTGPRPATTRRHRDTNLATSHRHTRVRDSEQNPT